MGSVPIPPDYSSLTRRLSGVERRQRQGSAARSSWITTATDRATAVQSAALVSGWNTLVTASVTWPSWARSAFVTVSANAGLVEALSAPEVYGGVARVVTNGVASHETYESPSYDPRTAEQIGLLAASDIVDLDTPSATVKAEFQFYPWHQDWYPGSSNSLAACHLLVVFIR